MHVNEAKLSRSSTIMTAEARHQFVLFKHMLVLIHTRVLSHKKVDSRCSTGINVIGLYSDSPLQVGNC